MTRSNRSRLQFERLESRDVPAVLTYTDFDGDKVTVTSTAGTNAELASGAHFLAISMASRRVLANSRADTRPSANASLISNTQSSSRRQMNGVT